jgi:hypothetical protein
MSLKRKWFKSSILALSAVCILESTTTEIRAEKWLLHGTASCNDCKDDKGINLEVDDPYETNGECVKKRAEFKKAFNGVSSQASIYLYCEKMG